MYDGIPTNIFPHYKFKIWSILRAELGCYKLTFWFLISTFTKWHDLIKGGFRKLLFGRFSKKIPWKLKRREVWIWTSLSLSKCMYTYILFGHLFPWATIRIHIYSSTCIQLMQLIGNLLLSFNVGGFLVSMKYRYKQWKNYVAYHVILRSACYR